MGDINASVVPNTSTPVLNRNNIIGSNSKNPFLKVTTGSDIKLAVASDTQTHTSTPVVIPVLPKKTPNNNIAPPLPVLPKQNPDIIYSPPLPVSPTTTTPVLDKILNNGNNNNGYTPPLTPTNPIPPQTQTIYPNPSNNTPQPLEVSQKSTDGISTPMLIGGAIFLLGVLYLTRSSRSVNGVQENELSLNGIKKHKKNIIKKSKKKHTQKITI